MQVDGNIFYHENDTRKRSEERSSEVVRVDSSMNYSTATNDLGDPVR